MNFKFMPELNSPWGYPFVIALMAVIAFILYKSFKNKHWVD
jgi:magnesium transporter